MTIAAVGTGHAATANSFSLTPGGTGHFILLWVTTESTTQWATALAGSNMTWTVLVAHQVFTTGGVSQTVFIGQCNSTSAANQTITFNTGTPVLRIAWQEFSTTTGYASITLDASGTIDVASSGKMPPATSTGTARTYGGYVFNNGTGTAGSTSGFTYFVDPNGNQLAYNTSCGSGLQQPNIGDTADGTSGIAVLVREAVTAHPGAAALTGTGVLTAGGIVAVPGAAVLAGTGALTAVPRIAIPAAATLLGTGSLTAAGGFTAPGQGSATLIGTGSMTVGGIIGWTGAAALSGTGVLGAVYTGLMLQTAALSGSGVMTAGAAATLRFTAGLFGGGFLSIPQVAGGLVNGVGGAGTPMALPGSSQVAVAPPGSTNWQWLGTLGQVTALTYSYVCPGGADKMTCTIMVPAAYRTQLFNPGWSVKITRGGHDVWHGKLDEPQPSASGWTLTAVGNGNRGTDYVAFFAPGDVWPAGEPDEIINRAISRGLPWVNTGLNSSPYFSQFWLGQGADPGSQSVTSFLNLITSRGGLTWYVNSQPGGVYGGDDLNVFPLPTVPNRLLLCTTPVARTLGGDINTIFIRYMSVADNTTASPPVSASYDVVSAINAQSVAAHGTLETYIDLSDVGQMSSSAAQSVGLAALQLYQRASFAGPFEASYGQLLNIGGAAIDPGTDQSATMVRMLLYDYGLGGEVSPGPITWIVGSYSWDDFKMVATLAPMQVLDQSLSGLLSAWNTANTPITVAST